MSLPALASFFLSLSLLPERLQEDPLPAATIPTLCARQSSFTRSPVVLQPCPPPSSVEHDAPPQISFAEAEATRPPASARMRRPRAATLGPRLLYIYIYIYIYTHTHIYIHTYIHTYIRTYIHAYIHTYIHTYLHTYINTYIHTYIHMYVYIYIYIYTHIYIYIHIYTHNNYVYIYMYTHTHRDTLKKRCVHNVYIYRERERKIYLYI